MEPVNDVAIRPPAGPLLRYVDKYTGYRMEGYEPGVHRGLPSPRLTFIISLGDPVDIAAMPDPRHPPVVSGALVSGLHEGNASIHHDGNQYGISLSLSPLGSRALFGLRASDLAGVIVDLDEVLGPHARSLPDRLASAPTWADRFAVLDDVLGAHLERRRTSEPRPEVTEAWTRVVASGGGVEVGALARELGWSRRHLGEQFRSELGLAPKVAARVVRFDRARKLLQSPRAPGLATVAAAVGYYDQAHLNREFQAMAGCSPSTWLAEELPSVQDEAAPAGAR